MRESVKKERWMDVPDLFWKKRQTLNKGQKRYADRSQHSSSKNAIKSNNYNWSFLSISNHEFKSIASKNLMKIPIRDWVVIDERIYAREIP